MKWTLKEPVPKKVRSKLHAFKDLEAQLLYSRGIEDENSALKFFSPALQDLIAPSSLPGAKKAAQIILKAIKDKKKIIIYGDYDVDGICATSILFDHLYRSLKADVIPYVPDRFEEGYGLSEQGINNILESGAELVITVDCGIRDEKLIKKYIKKGLQFIITDHHSLPSTLEILKTASAVVHPNLDESDNHICATAVVWKLIQVLEELSDVRSKDKNSYLDLVALATVCDIMPLSGENRILVKAGLDLIADDTYNRGLSELSRLANITSKSFDTYHFGFVLGPRLNAAGRIEHALDGVRLLTSHDELKVKQLALKLNDLNYKRQQITKKMFEEAFNDAQEQVLSGKKLIFVYRDEWNEGVVGLVASKLNEKFHLPVLVANLKKGIVKGSARSIVGFDITNAIAQNADILEKFGGHNQAAGFTLSQSNVDKFKLSLQDFASNMISPDMLTKELKIDGVIDLDDIDSNVISVIKKFRPFGFGNPEPLFLIKNVSIYGTLTAVGRDKRHLRFNVTNGNKFMNVIGFNMIDKIDTIRTTEAYDLVGTLELNEWNSKVTIQIKLRDLKRSKNE